MNDFAPKPIVTVEEVEKTLTPMQRSQRQDAGRKSAARRKKGVGGGRSKKKSARGGRKTRGGKGRTHTVSQEKFNKMIRMARKKGLKVENAGKEGRANIVLPNGKRLQMEIRGSEKW